MPGIFGLAFIFFIMGLTAGMLDVSMTACAFILTSSIPAVRPITKKMNAKPAMPDMNGIRGTKRQ